MWTRLTFNGDSGSEVGEPCMRGMRVTVGTAIENAKPNREAGALVTVEAFRQRIRRCQSDGLELGRWLGLAGGPAENAFSDREQSESAQLTELTRGNPQRGQQPSRGRFSRAYR